MRGRAKAGELGADLAGVGMAEVVQNGERFLPGGAGLIRLTGGESGVAEVTERLGLGPPVPDLPVQAEGPLVTGGRFGMVAEMELGFIRDRQRAGIDAAKAKGVYKGRPVTFDRARIVALRKEGMGATEIAKAVGCKRGNVYKALKAAGLN